MTLKSTPDLELELKRTTPSEIRKLSNKTTFETPRNVLSFCSPTTKYKKCTNTSPERRRRLRQLVVKKLVKLRINNGNPFYDTLRKVFTLRVARR